MPLSPSPIRLLKDLIKKEFSEDPEVMSYLEYKTGRIETARYSDIDETNLPLCLITNDEEDLSRLSQDYDERSEVSIIVEFHGFYSKTINFDDFCFYIRQKLSNLDVRSILGRNFESFKIEKILYFRKAVGTKNVQQAAFKLKTHYDIELNEAIENYTELSGVTVDNIQRN